MIRLVPTLVILLGLLVGGAAAAAESPKVRLVTNEGEIVLSLNADAAPATVSNFLDYVRSGFYDGTIFHRVMSDFMIQGGGFTGDFDRKNTRAPIANEADNGLKNVRGTIAMARTSNPHSATSQFFINVKDNPALNHRKKSGRGWGYAVFGRVVDGMDVVDRIRNVPTTVRGPHRNVPVEPVVIQSAVVEAATSAE